MYNLETVKDIVGTILIFTGVLDALKYSLQAWKIKKSQSSKIISRKFVVFAIINDVVRLLYSILIRDVFIFVASILAFICMAHLWWNVYIHYPYKFKGLAHFKRPNIWIFTLNALIPNNLRRHL